MNNADSQNVKKIINNAAKLHLRMVEIAAVCSIQTFAHCLLLPFTLKKRATQNRPFLRYL